MLSAKAMNFIGIIIILLAVAILSFIFDDKEDE